MMIPTRNSRTFAIGVGGMLIAAASWIWLGDGLGETDVALTPDDPEVVAHGHEIYAEQCASCHGANLEGEANWRQRKPSGRLPAPPHDATGHTWHHPDQQLFELTKHGPAALVGGDYESDMPAYDGSLDDDDIVAVLSFIKSTWPAEVRHRHDLINGPQR